MTRFASTLAAPAAMMMAVGSSPALAELPAPVRAMLDAAIASGNEADISAIARVAKSTNPEDAGEIDALVGSYRQTIAEMALQQKREAGFLDGWRGSGELGGFVTSGNTQSTGLSAGLTINKDGIQFRHKVRATVDYQRSDGLTTRNQWLASYEPNFRLNDGFYLFGLFMFEKDRFQGFADRLTLSGGFGYRAIDAARLKLDVKGGPAWRGTDWIADPRTDELELLGGADLVWNIAPGIDFTNNAQAVWGSDNSTYSNTAAFTAKFSRALSGRLSYGLRHETNPPLASEKTDTVTRATIVYGF